MPESQVAEAFTLIATANKAEASDFGIDVREGLTGSPKKLSCRYFYDRRGSELFEAICDLPEYYLTRAEREILETHVEHIVSQMQVGTTLVELGSGSAAKTRLVLEAFLRYQEELLFVPLDISRTMLESASKSLLASYPDLMILGIASEYGEGLRQVDQAVSGPKLILWLGSSVGNFDPREASQFLAGLQARMGPEDGLLMGVDLKKDPVILEAAYNDAEGATAAFNLNLLTRINRELGGRFDLDAFVHGAIYDVSAGRIEMYLTSLRNQIVRIDDLDLCVSFRLGESIFTESSYKYTPAEIESLVDRAGLRIDGQWMDTKERFSLNLLRTR